MAGYIGTQAVSVNTTSATISDDLSVGDDLTVTDDATIGGTLGVTGVVTANAGVVVDEMTLDADTLTATDDFIIDAVGEIVLDSATGITQYKDGGTEFLRISESSGDAVIQSTVQDKKIFFSGDDNGGGVNALILDMADAGAATFNSSMHVGADVDLVQAKHIRFKHQAGGTIRASISAESDDRLQFNTSSSEVARMTINSGGAVTIGNDGFGQSLGNLRVVEDAENTAPAIISLFGRGNVADAAEFAKIQFAQQTTGTGGHPVAQIVGEAVGTNENAAQLIFSTATGGTLSEKLRISNTGLISTNQDINTNISVTNSKDGSAVGFGLIRVDADATSYSASTRAIVVDFSNTDHSSAQIAFVFAGAQGVKGSITSTGNTSCSFSTSSDERLKTDIQDLTDGLTTINTLKPRKYKWISEGANAEYDHGFVAQELYEDYSKPVNVGGEDPKTEPWSVENQSLVPILVKALQEADAKIEALTLRVTALEG